MAHQFTTLGGRLLEVQPGHSVMTPPALQIRHRQLGGQHLTVYFCGADHSSPISLKARRRPRGVPARVSNVWLDLLNPTVGRIVWWKSWSGLRSRPARKCRKSRFPAEAPISRTARVTADRDSRYRNPDTPSPVTTPARQFSVRPAPRDHSALR